MLSHVIRSCLSLFVSLYGRKNIFLCYFGFEPFKFVRWTSALSGVQLLVTGLLSAW